MSATARPTYRFADNATSNTANEYGNHIIRRGMGEIRKPSWNRTETVVRLLPQWDFEADKWVDFRRSPAPYDYGDWIRRYDAVRGFGDTGITMLLFDPIANPAYDIQSNPCVILYRAINNAITNKQCEPDWPALLKGGAGKRAPLSRSTPLFLARCGIFCIKSKDMATSERSPLGLASSDPAFFLELPKTAGEKLMSLLETPKEGYAGDPDSPDAWQYGDIISLDKGAYVSIFEEGADPRVAQAAAQANSAPRQLTLPVGTGGRGNYGGGGDKSGFQGFDCFISPTWRGFAAALNTPELEKLIKSKQRPWEECLQFYDHKEQAFLVQDGFPPNAILYAWRDHPEWIKDETRNKAVNRVSVPMDPRIQQPGSSFPAGFNVGRMPAGPALVQPPPASQSPASAAGMPGGMAGIPVAGPALVAAPAPIAPSNPAVKVGGWGTAANDAATGKEEGRDTVVPSALPESVTTPAPDAGTPANRAEQANSALAKARARNASRS